MQVRDEVAWQEQLTEFEADDVARKFRDFLVFWMQTAEKLLEESSHGHNGEVILGYADPVNNALEVAEQTMGFLSVEWIAQMLLVMTEHFPWGEQLFRDMSHIEKRLVEQATAMKLADLQMAAKMPVEE